PSASKSKNELRIASFPLLGADLRTFGAQLCPALLAKDGVSVVFGLTARASGRRHLWLRLRFALRHDRRLRAESLRHVGRGFGAQRREVLLHCAKQTLGLGAVPSQKLFVIAVGNLADAALVLEILERLQHGSLLLLGGARRAQGQRLVQRD